MSVAIENFKGLVLDLDAETRGHETASDCANVTLDDVHGIVRGSIGAKKYNSTAATTANIDGIYDHRTKVDGTNHLLVHCGGNLYKWASASTWTTVQETAYTADTVVQGVTINENSFFVNGTDSPWYYNGTSYGAWGTASPLAPTVADGAAADTAITGGVREIFVTHYNSTTLAESCPSPIVRHEVAFASPKKISITVPAEATGYDKLRIWMTLADTPCTFYLVAEYSTDTTAHDGADVVLWDALDTTLSASTVWQDFNMPPAKPHGIFKFGQELTRIAVYGSPDYPSRLWWTHSLEPFRFSDDNWMEFGSDDGDRIQAAGQCSSAVLVLKRNGVYAMVGQGPTTFAALSLNSPFGATARYSLVIAQGQGFWINQRGVFTSSGLEQPKNISEGKVRAWVEAINWSYPDFVRGFYVAERNQIWWTAAYGTSTTPNKCLVYDIDTGEFTVTDKAFYASCVGMFSGVEQTLFDAGATDNGFVIRLTDRDATPVYNWTKTDGTDATAQDMYWTSQWIPTGGMLAEIEVFHELQSAGSLSVTVTGANTADDADSFVTSDLTMRGTDITIDQTDYKVYRYPCRMAKNFVKVRLRNSTVSQTFGVRRVVLHTAEAKRRGMNV